MKSSVGVFIVFGMSGSGLNKAVTELPRKLVRLLTEIGSKAGNKGVDAAVSAIELVNLLTQLPKRQ